MTKVTTLMFDLDGTLVDSNELIIASFLHVFDKFCPGRYTREDVTHFIGPTLIETFGAIDPNKIEEMTRVYREFSNAWHDKMTQEFTGVTQTISKLYKEGYKLAIVTSKIKESAVKSLEFCRLKQYFSYVIGSDCVTNPKPFAEPIIKTLQALDSKPSEALMIGDRHHDILAGQNACVKTVGVAWSLMGIDYLKKYKPDFIIHKMSDLLEIIHDKQEKLII